MSLPSTVALFGALATLLWFLRIAYQKKARIRDLDDLLFYGRTLESKGYSRTFIATGISLATVLTFFLDFGGRFGLALLVSPLAYLAGVYILLRAIPALETDGYLHKGTTLHSFLGTIFGSDRLRLLTAAVSLLGYVGILVIEIHVGVQIVRTIHDSTAGIVVAATILASLIGSYTWLAGFQAVVDTDKAQLRLIGAGTIAAFLALGYLMVTDKPPGAFPLELFVPAPWRLPLALLLVMIFGNVPLQILRMSNWQRIAAVSNGRAVRSGLVRAIGWTFLFWILFNVLGILLHYVSPQAEGVGSLVLLNVVVDSGGLLAYVLYPIIFVGLLSALISTADSVLVPILTAWIYDFRHHHELHQDGWAADPEAQDLQRYLFSARRSVKYFLAGTLALYAILVGLARFDFISLLFVFFNQQLVLLATVMCSLDERKDGLRRAVPSLMLGVGFGWASVWIVTGYGAYTDNQQAVFYAALIGLVVSTLIPLMLSSRAREGFIGGVRRLLNRPQRSTEMP